VFVLGYVFDMVVADEAVFVQARAKALREHQRARLDARMYGTSMCSVWWPADWTWRSLQ